MTARLLHSRVSEDEGEGRGPSYFTHEERRRGGEGNNISKERNNLTKLAQNSITSD